jgi:hypothetical protein
MKTDGNLSVPLKLEIGLDDLVKRAIGEGISEEGVFFEIDEYGKVAAVFVACMMEMFDLNSSSLSASLPGTGGYDASPIIGVFPDEPINLHGMLGHYMSGFTLDKSDMKVMAFFSGSETLADSILEIKLHAESDGWYSTPIVAGSANQKPNIYNNLKLPASRAEFDRLLARTDAIDAGLMANQIITEMPEALQFGYSITLKQVSSGGTAQVPDGALNALVLARVPLQFIAGAGAEIMLPLFDEGAIDLFGREKVGQPIFGNAGLEIDSLRFALDFDNNLFKGKGATFHIHDPAGLPDDQILFGRGGLNQDGRNGNLDIRITGKDLAIIDNNLIRPLARIVFPSATTFGIPMNPMPTRITISVKGSYVIGTEGP